MRIYRWFLDNSKICKWFVDNICGVWAPSAVMISVYACERAAAIMMKKVTLADIGKAVIISMIFCLWGAMEICLSLASWRYTGRGITSHPPE